MALHERRRGDTKALRTRLKDRTGFLDLSGVGTQVKFLMRLVNTSGSAETLGTVTIEPEVKGQVRFDPDPADVAVTGLYDAEFQVTAGGEVVTIPAKPGDFRVRIYPDLGD